jgi:hypothetical protein
LIVKCGNCGAYVTRQGCDCTPISDCDPVLPELEPTGWRAFSCRLDKIEVPESKIGQFAFFFTIQCLSYFLFVANGRAYTVALHPYFWTGITDALYAFQSFFFLSKFVTADPKSRGAAAMLGYVAGGVTGSLLSILLTHHLYGR